MQYIGQRFSNQTVKVDGHEFVDCTFIDCKIVFTGISPTKLENCVFDYCQWVFDGPAEHTIQYLAAMFNGLGPGGREIVEGIFDSIRQGGVGHGLLLHTPSPVR